MSDPAMMAEYYAAREAWELQAEQVTMLYATELSEYRVTNPPPLLADFMRNRLPREWRQA
jgi:hypothetical protein